MLALIWWMYSGYAWLTNAVSTRGSPGGRSVVAIQPASPSTPSS